ncbi:MAG TPA: hypothetical protein VGY55_04010 [Pirellulales bacterium]|jgi:hypothetical protein|nr:hypothetical protein [Pirellulales bacterium]
MSRLSHRRHLLPVWTLFVSLLTPTGCGQNNQTPPKEKDVEKELDGTSTAIALGETEPPVLTKAIADRIRPGLSQEEVLSLLQDAARNTRAAGSLDSAVALGKLNDIRFDLTVSQGKRKLVLAFKDRKLVDKTQEGLE